MRKTTFAFVLLTLIAVSLQAPSGQAFTPERSTSVSADGLFRAFELEFLCFCTCTTGSGATQVKKFEIPSGGNCSSLNEGGCAVGEEQGELGGCNKGPKPIERTALSFMTE